MREEEGFHWTQRGKKRGRGGGGWEEELLPSAVLPPASFSPHGHGRKSWTPSLPPSLISPLAVFLYLCLNLWNLRLFLFHLLFSSCRPSLWLSILPFSPHFIAFPNSSTSISILHLHPPSSSPLFLEALNTIALPSIPPLPLALGRLLPDLDWSPRLDPTPLL